MARVDQRKSTQVIVAAFLLSACLYAQQQDQERLKHAGEVMAEILGGPDNLPQAVLNRAECVIVVPSVKKFAIGTRANYGRGPMSCRSGSEFMGPWGPPAMYSLEAAGTGSSLGGQATDFVLLVMTRKGVQALLKIKTKLGEDVSAAIGPKDRNVQAASDPWASAEVLTYARSRGLFAGVSLEGSTLRPADIDNKNVYGRDITAKQIVIEHKGRMPPAGHLLIDALQKASPQKVSDVK